MSRRPGCQDVAADVVTVDTAAVDTAVAMMVAVRAPAGSGRCGWK
jgi:hypothetical protein